MQGIKLVGSGVDTLILNVRYCDSKSQPIKQELAEKLVQELDYLQGEARLVETAVATDWVFQDVLLFVEPHGAGKQWRWLLTSRLLTIAVSRGKLNDIIAQVRFSSEYLWSQEWCGDALTTVHTFLMSLFGEDIHLQMSEVHLCADVVGYDFSQCNYETQFVTRVRKNEAIYGADSVSLDCHRVSTLAFSRHKAWQCTSQRKGSANRCVSGAMAAGVRKRSRLVGLSRQSSTSVWLVERFLPGTSCELRRSNGRFHARPSVFRWSGFFCCPVETRFSPIPKAKF